MQYPRAGLVTLLFALIISLVSAVPVPSTESIFSSTLSTHSHGIPNLNGQDRTIQLLTGARNSEILYSGRMSTLPRAARLTHKKQFPTDTDEQLVRRSIFDKIKHAFQSFGNKVKSGFQKAGNAIKQTFQKAGSAIKKGFQKVGSAIKQGAQKVKQGFQKAGTAIKHGFQKVGSAIKQGAQKVKQGFQKAGTAIKHGFQKAGTAIKKGFQKVGKGIVTAAKKVGHFMKTTGAKVAKFGLKVVQTWEKVGSKIVRWIPGIGKPLSKVMDGVSAAAGAISDRIHVKLPSKLEKGMNVMNKANKIMEYIPREFSEEEGFQQRDIDEAYHFEERDDIALENREEFYSEVDERDIYERYDLD